VAVSYAAAENVFRDAEANIERARALLPRLQPLEGTPAEAYLIVTRRIPADVVRACQDLRYLAPPINGRPPQDHALVSLLRDAAGEVSGFQLEFVDIAGARTGTEPAKVTYALRPGGVAAGLFHAGGSGDVALLVEGYSCKALAIASLGIGRAYGAGARTVIGWAAPAEQTVTIIPDRRPADTVVDLKTRKSAGHQHDLDYTRAVDLLLIAGKTVLMAKAPECQHPGGGTCTDADDYLRRHGPILLKDLIETTEVSALSLDGEARQLAKIDDPLERDAQTKARATELKVRVALLRERVAHYRGEAQVGAAAAEADGVGTPLSLPDAAPWPDPVDGDALIGEILGKLVEFVVLFEPDAVAAALWIIHTHAHDTAFHSPRLAVTSPTLRCGKSTLLRCLLRLCRRPLSSSNVSPAVIYRVIEALKPTLLIDELDQMDQEKHREIVGIINSSHCRLDAQVLRTVGDNHEPRAFSTWAPIALAGIGKLPAQWIDRSIRIRMRRRKRDERTARMRLDRDQGFTRLSRMAARWAADNTNALREADPGVPEGMNDRAADNWRHLLAIADRAGGDWPRRARNAAVALSTDTEDAESVGITLLVDVKTVFDETNAADQWSEELLAALKAMPERPWAELSRGKGLSGKRMADLLKAFGIRSRQIKRGATNKHGYDRKDFLEAWDRYCAPQSRASQSAETLPATDSASLGDFQNATVASAAADQNGPKATETAEGSVSADCGPRIPPEPPTCTVCGTPFEHSGGGRRPVRCPACRGGGKQQSTKNEPRHSATAEVDRVADEVITGKGCAYCSLPFNELDEQIEIHGRHYHRECASWRSANPAEGAPA
jgi:hypothetical protein